MEEGRVVVYRKGGISLEALQNIIPDIEVRNISQSDPLAPGMLESHYAPSCPLIIVDNIDISQYPDKKVGVISFSQKIRDLSESLQYVLSEKGDFGEAAQQLFKAMRHLDAMNLDLIVVKLLPEEDLGRAINDRLRRAASR
jgi:L-threonylcarbamoyladenylate synthase